MKGDTVTHWPLTTVESSNNNISFQQIFQNDFCCKCITWEDSNPKGKIHFKKKQPTYTHNTNNTLIRKILKPKKSYIYFEFEEEQEQWLIFRFFQWHERHGILGLASGYTLTVMKAAKKFKDVERAKDKVGCHYFYPSLAF